MKPWLDFILGLVLPKICPACGCQNAQGNFLCGDCLEKIPINSGWFCPDCGRRLPDPKNSCHSGAGFILAAAAAYADKSVQETVQILKYGKLEKAAADLAILIEKYVAKTADGLDYWLPAEILIIPIPLYPKKERERGFNQSWLLAQAVEKIMAGAFPVKTFRLEKNVLKRKRNTLSQTRCPNHRVRRENIAGAFETAEPEKIANKAVVIVDDVFTSGATIKEAVKTLKAAGAKKIMALVAAKA